MRLLVSIVFLILVISSFGKTGNEYWSELQKVANKRYSGIAGDVSVEVTVDETKEGSGSMTLKVPIYSKQDKISMAENKESFLKDGADLIEEMQNCDVKITSLGKQMKLMKAIMSDEGTSAVKDYYEAEIKMEEAKNTKNRIVKLLDAMVN